MNEKLQEALAALITKTTDGAVHLTNMVSAELPDVVRQLLLYKFVECLIMFIVGVVLFGVIFWAVKKIHRLLQKEIEEDETAGVLYVPLGCVSALLVTLNFIIFINLTWLKIWLAPKLYLIEYAASLMGGK